ncbi:hypothetical protein [uncultured Enterococcus sp.]|uniref:hypothetical protein n=1 Tax=uncultured Enterococcus sp. TaxID=167972 RepID=UPI002AA85B9B|nr:hypothetical protein [uncultured Enterococcus sp.]
MMKKWTVVLSVLAAAFVVVSFQGESNAEEQRSGYIQILNDDLRMSIEENTEAVMNEAEQALYDEYQLFSPRYLGSVETMYSSGNIMSLEGYQYLPNLKSYGEHEGSIGADPRPLTKLAQLEELSLDSNFYSIEFLKNLKSLKILGLDNTPRQRGYEELDRMDKSILPLVDLTVLNQLDSLEEVYIGTEGYLPAITLRTGKTSYTMANPIFLSKQFIEDVVDEEGNVIGTEESQLEVRSTNEDFSFADDELTWANLSPEMTELRFYWNAASNTSTTDNAASVRGMAIIPIVWK